MVLRQQIALRLQQIEQIMREHQHWQSVPPAEAALASTEPFCLDTLTPLEWLQWVLLPRMQALIHSRSPLPHSFAIVPYFELALEATTPGRELLLITLRHLDALFERAG